MEILITTEDSFLLEILQTLSKKIKFNVKVITNTTENIPNKTTINAINELKSGKGTRYKSVDDMVNQLSK